MKTINRISLLSSLIFSIGALTGCNNKKKEETRKKLDSDTLYVKKVENLNDDFIMSMDASSVISLERSGVKYYDYDGKEKDVFAVLKESSINYIRVRVWNNPYDSQGHGYGGGNSDINTALEIGKRATANGLKLLVDFHYSDFWADPARQTCPKAWSNLSSVSKKAEALKEYTEQSLTLLKNNGVDIGMVQIGNEINEGHIAGEYEWYNSQVLLNAASDAVRNIDKNIKIAVHFTNPERKDSLLDYAAKLNKYNVYYDVFGVSYYPFWHGTLNNLSSALNAISDKYDKDVMVLETSYPFDTKDTDFMGNVISESSDVPKYYKYSVNGQALSVNKLTDTMVNEVKRGIGISYWEGCWISVGHTSWENNEKLWDRYGSGWANKYASDYDSHVNPDQNEGCTWENQAMFDQNGHPLESLKVFNLMFFGNEGLGPDA